MRVCIEGPERLNCDSLEAIGKNKKTPLDFMFNNISWGEGGSWVREVELFGGGSFPCPPPPPPPR